MSRDSRYDSLIQHYAAAGGFTGRDWLKFKSQIKAESNFDPDAVSSVGAAGLAQFMPATFVEYATKLRLKNASAFNPEHAISCQIEYMKWLLQRLTTWDAAFAAYNWGIGNVLKVFRDPKFHTLLPDETSNYIDRIETYFAEYSR